MIRHLLILCLFLSSRAAAQTSVRDGVFTSAQAQRGQTAYGEECARCHGQNLAGGEGAPELAAIASSAAGSAKAWVP